MFSNFVYLVAYAGTILCLAVVGYKIYNYVKKPVHIRWELYPVPHEGARAEHGGSYLEDAEWWNKEREHSFIGMIKGLCVEMLFMHSTFEHNRSLWVRTYPFHAGLYLIIGAIFLAIIDVIFTGLGLPMGLLKLISGLISLFCIIGFIGVIYGTIALMHRRITDPGLLLYTTREHFLNLGAFLLFGLLGLFAWITAPFGEYFVAFMNSMLTFSFAPIHTMPDSTMFMLFMCWAFVMVAYVPVTHMAHFFMKYFLYHDIRWGDTPTQDSKVIQEKINQVLGYPVSWQAPHIGGDGKKTWAEVATTNPAKKDN